MVDAVLVVGSDCFNIGYIEATQTTARLSLRWWWTIVVLNLAFFDHLANGK